MPATLRREVASMVVEVCYHYRAVVVQRTAMWPCELVEPSARAIIR